MIIPFSFMNPNVATIVAIDPAILYPTLYWKDYTSSPWAGSASAGTSGSNASAAITAPTAGATFGRHTSLHFNGTSTAITSAGTASTFITASGIFTFQCIANFASPVPAANAAGGYLEASMLSDANGIVSMQYTASGVRASLNANPVFPNTPYVPIAAGVTACIQAVYDGTTLKIRVNGGSWASTPGATPLTVLLSSGTIISGKAVSGATYITGDFAQYLIFNTALSDATMDGLYLNAQANYGGPALLAPTVYLKDYAAVSPWAGTASIGTSGTRTAAVSSGSAGAAFGIHTSLHLSGTGGFITQNSTLLSAIISASAFSMQFIAKMSAAVASGTLANEASLFTDRGGGNVNVTYSTSGVRAGIAGGGTTSYVTLATGVAACIQVVYNGVTLKIRVNGGTWSSVASTNVPVLTGNINVCGLSAAGAAWLTGDLAQVAIFNTTLSDATMDALYSDAHDNYGV
jgi:hypothetical protein